jgi:hypothetical protein
VGIFGGGEVFGEMALLTKEPRSASLKTLTNTTTIEITSHSLEEISKIDPKIMESIWDSYSEHKFDNCVSSIKQYAGLSKGEKVLWFKTAKKEGFARHTTYTPPSAEYIYLFILSGFIDLNGKRYLGPRLIHVNSQNEMTTPKEATGYWLKSLKNKG